jgi:hypothetical protein
VSIVDGVLLGEEWMNEDLTKIYVDNKLSLDMRDPPEEEQEAVQISASSEMINVLLGDISVGGSWPVEFAPEKPQVGVVEVNESEWRWYEPEVPNNQEIFLPYELVEDNVKLEYGKYSEQIAVNQLRIGEETYIPNTTSTLRPCSHPPEHIDTVVLNSSTGFGIKWLNFSSSGDSEQLLCKRCKTPL